MELKDTIYRRKSFRSYKNEELDASTLLEAEEFLKSAKRLYPDCKLHWESISPENVKCMLPWRAPHNLAIYCERETKSLVNLGFVFQQFDLYLQSKGIGTCWLGLGKPFDKPEYEGMDCVMMLAFGKSIEFFRDGTADFTRKAITDISDTEDMRLEPAQLAPSAINGQPWYFVHEENIIHTYCKAKFITKQFLGDMNKMDIGIALAHMFVSNEETFRYFEVENAPEVKGYMYIGSFEI